ncbi:IS110 family transposase [Reticulibacter mediterranei]|uniref:IS110 family transposase n=1 Tax=Reticulibacter mediterranei TaxID=2778369 RepID=A0A8J3J2C9_9CHLR|nr:IS110 family transposase [Reticulibacter mediterranei]GHO99501.1 IS110 family transposase [Reticulibacter mediterranei]
MVAVAQIPRLHNEPLYVGIDVSKNTHMVALISPFLLRKNGRYDACPTFEVKNTQAGFDDLIARMECYAPRSECVVLMEQTGHYHRPLQQYLLNIGIAVYEIHVQKRPSRNKSDKRDALNLANLLYNQLELKAQATDSMQIAHRVIGASATATTLRPLVMRRFELAQRSTRCRNQLIAICDELFPEFTQAIKDPNGASALRIREHFPTPGDIAAASVKDLKAFCPGVQPSARVLGQLQELASCSVGIKDPARIEALLFEQGQLIAELRLLREHMEVLDEKIEALVEGTREGVILTSIPMISPLRAASILASIGIISNFRSSAALKAYFGWSPVSNQTGTSTDTMKLGRGGNRLMKQTMYMTGLSAIRGDTEWRSLYQELVLKKCPLDLRTKKRKGKNKALGAVIGRIIGTIYFLLKKDYDLLQQLPLGETPPPPMCYDRAVHKAHRRR